MEISQAGGRSTVAGEGSFSAPVRLALPLLVLLSGFCGISYEILYTKLLGNLLGQQFIINATVLLTFLLGIGFGTLYAHRFARYLWAIEAGIGLYATMMVAGYAQIDALLYRLLPTLGTSVYACALVSVVLLSVPAFLIGCSLPLFAAYLGSMWTTRVFSVTYGIYNLGAALTALGMEFLVLRLIGLRAATLWLAALNAVVALSLIGLVRAAPVIPAPRADRRRFPARVFWALGLASLGSAVFQLLMMKIAEFLFGPYNETFSLVLATVLLGLAAGSWACGKLRWSFSTVLLLALAGLVWLLVMIPPSVAAYAMLYPTCAQIYPLLVLLKFGLVLVLMAIPAIGFGATIPALLATHVDVARESGQLLFCSSLANVGGFVLMAFCLHQYFDYGVILLLIAVVAAIAIALHEGLRRRATAMAAGLVLLAGVGLAFAWDETFLYLGYTNFHSTAELKRQKTKRVLADRFKGPQDVFAIVWVDGDPYFFINGYVEMPIAGENASEKLVGAMSGMLSPRLDQALVLGLGSGATAGSVGLIFDKTDVVEINQVVKDHQHLMAEYNFDVIDQPNTTIIHDDGIHHIKTVSKKYSLILNTVTTPLYFSASKLYTRDFLRAVQSKLTPDGVYVTWVDGRIGDRGFDIVLNTLADTFPECWLYYLDASYFLMTCSDTPIRLHRYEALAHHPRLHEHFAAENGLDLARLPYSIISTNMADLISSRDLPVNTLDFPILEFEMSRLPADYYYFEGFLERLERSKDMKRLVADLAPEFAWDPAEFLHFTDLRVKSTWYFSRVLFRKVNQEIGFVDRDAYREAARNIAAGTGTAIGFYKTGRALADRDFPEDAVAAYETALALDPRLSGVHYHLGRSLEDLDRYEEALAAFVQEWDQHRDWRVPMKVAGLMTELKRPREAQQWLELAPDDERDSAAYAYYEGAVREQLGDLPQASQFYHLALERAPKYKPALAALARLQGFEQGTP